MKNGKHKANSFNSFQFVVKKASLLPSLQGGAGGRLFPLTKREARLTSMKHTAWGGDDEGEGEQCARGG